MKCQQPLLLFCLCSTAYFLLLFIHDITSSIHVQMLEWIERNFMRWCILWELPIIVAPMIRNYIWQRLIVLCQQNRSLNRTLGYSIHKGARNRHNVINSNRLTAIMNIGCKPLKSNVPNSKDTFNLSRRMEWRSVSNAALRSNRAMRETNLSPAFTNRQSRTLSTAVSMLQFFL